MANRNAQAVGDRLPPFGHRRTAARHDDFGGRHVRVLQDSAHHKRRCLISSSPNCPGVVCELKARQECARRGRKRVVPLAVRVGQPHRDGLWVPRRLTEAAPRRHPPYPLDKQSARPAWGADENRLVRVRYHPQPLSSVRRRRYCPHHKRGSADHQHLTRISESGHRPFSRNVNPAGRNDRLAGLSDGDSSRSNPRKSAHASGVPDSVLGPGVAIRQRSQSSGDTFIYRCRAAESECDHCLHWPVAVRIRMALTQIAKEAAGFAGHAAALRAGTATGVPVQKSGRDRRAISPHGCERRGGPHDADTRDAGTLHRSYCSPRLPMPDAQGVVEERTVGVRHLVRQAQPVADDAVGIDEHDLRGARPHVDPHRPAAGISHRELAEVKGNLDGSRSALIGQRTERSSPVGQVERMSEHALQA
jgi:hypothetical protein